MVLTSGSTSDYLILKPKHSAFYQTPLDTIYRDALLFGKFLAGLSTTSCILRTAHDANMRELQLYVPSGCSAACQPAEHQQAIDQIALIRNAKVTPSRSLRLHQIRRRAHSSTENATEQN